MSHNHNQGSQDHSGKSQHESTTPTEKGGKQSPYKTPTDPAQKDGDKQNQNPNHGPHGDDDGSV